LAIYILLSKGALCTPRSVIRSITAKKKPSTIQVVDEMKLTEGGVGSLKLYRRKKVFFKLVPTEANKEILTAHVDVKEYETNFEIPIEGKYITAAQHNRILEKRSEKDTLISKYGYSKR
jgi:hypothetical protein